MLRTKQNRLGQFFFSWIKYRHASNVIVMQNTALEVYCTENKQTGKPSVLYFIISSIFLLQGSNPHLV